MYVFRTLRAHQSGKGELLAVFVVKDQRYTQLKVQNKEVLYDQPIAGTERDYARIEKYVWHAGVDPHRPLSIVESAIPISDHRLFGPGGLVDDPSQRGMPFSVQISVLGDLSLIGTPPTPDEIEETFGWDEASQSGSDDAQAWKRQRRHRFANKISLVELFSVDAFAEARRRNANYAHALRQLYDYLHEPERSRMAFVARGVSRIVARYPKYGKQIDGAKLESWHKKG